MTKREQIRALLLETPTLTQRAVAQALGVSPGYVHPIRAAMQQAGELPSREMRAKRQPGEVVDSLDVLIDHQYTFGTILIDPPWPYENQGTRGATKPHYQAMSLDALKALPIAALAQPTAHLHLWTTNAFLADALQLMAIWGFTFKSILLWIKPQIGIGNYWRVSHELLLLGVHGHRPFPKNGYKSWFLCKRGRHSAKPEQARRMIEHVSPGPFLECFGRQIVDGWTVWGDQFEDTLFNQPLEEPMTGAHDDVASKYP